MARDSIPNRFNKGKQITTAAIIVVAVGFIIFGVCIGEAGEVLQKAINICLECIGVG